MRKKMLIHIFINIVDSKYLYFNIGMLFKTKNINKNKNSNK